MFTPLIVGAIMLVLAPYSTCCNVTWTEWSEWSSCIGEPAEGIAPKERRYRDCVGTGSDCLDFPWCGSINNWQFRECSCLKCTHMRGVWGAWSEWSGPCPGNSGYVQRVRACELPAGDACPEDKLMMCPGSNTQFKVCDTGAQCDFFRWELGAWAEWSQCKYEDLVGTTAQQRHRSTCVVPDPVYGCDDNRIPVDCYGRGLPSDFRTCTLAGGNETLQ